MSIIDKMQFWKKNDEPFSEGADQRLHLPELDGNYGGPSRPTMPDMPPLPQHPNSFAPSQTSFQQPQRDKDIEIIEAKLDTIKSLLDNINQRLSNIERLARE